MTEKRDELEAKVLINICDRINKLLQAIGKAAYYGNVDDAIRYAKELEKWREIERIIKGW